MKESKRIYRKVEEEDYDPMLIAFLKNLKEKTDEKDSKKVDEKVKEIVKEIPQPKKLSFRENFASFFGSLLKI